eukprot:s1010_g27.t1
MPARRPTCGENQELQVSNLDLVEFGAISSAVKVVTHFLALRQEAEAENGYDNGYAPLSQKETKPLAKETASTCLSF